MTDETLDRIGHAINVLCISAGILGVLACLAILAHVYTST